MLIRVFKALYPKTKIMDLNNSIDEIITFCTQNKMGVYKVTIIKVMNTNAISLWCQEIDQHGKGCQTVKNYTC